MKAILISVLVLSLLTPLAASAYSLTGQHWDYGNPTYVPVTFQSSIPGAWITPFAHAMSAWNQVGARFRFQGGNQGHDVALKYLWFDNSLAVTYIREGSGTRTIDRDTDFNSKYSWDVNGDPNKYDAWEVLTHELGHWLTLNDLYAPTDYWKTMYGYSGKGETYKRTLDQDDINGIRAIYGTL